MALKPFRNFGCGTGSKVTHVMDVVAEKGIIVVQCTGSTGSGLPGDPQNKACVPPSSGTLTGLRPIGVLLTDVVNIDVTKCTHLGRIHRSETTPGNNVEIGDKITVCTNQLAASINPNPGDPAYMTFLGKITNASVGTVLVGKFEGKVQPDGYAVVTINL